MSRTLFWPTVLLITAVVVNCSGDGVPTPPSAGQPQNMEPSSEFSFLQAGGASPDLRFMLEAQQTYLFQFDQMCDSRQGLCCELILHRSQPGTPTRVLAHSLLDPLNSSVSAPFEISATGELRGNFRAWSNCSYRLGALISTNSADTVVSLELDGQVKSHTVELQTIGGRYYLRDISRRASISQGIGLAHEQAITVERFHDLSNAGLFTSLLSYPVNSSSVPPAIAQAVDALAYSQLVYDFFLENLSYNSRNNRGVSMQSVIERPFPPFDLTCGDNTIAKGSSFNAFSSGSAIYFTPAPADVPIATLSASLDVVAHEWSHSYEDGFATLEYARQSGALSEAFADWVAVRVSREGGEQNWEIGNGVRWLDGSNRELSVLRDMTVPRRLNDELWRPDTLELCPIPDLCSDYCGVHRNNAVPNYAFYLLSDGGSVLIDHDNNPTTPERQVVIHGIGIDKAFRIAFAAYRHFWTSTSSFLNVRAGMEMAGAMLFPDQPEVVAEIGKAWAVVSVGQLPSE